MEDATNQMIAVCGLDCGNCDLRKVPSDPEAAQRVVAWFREMGWLNESEGISEVMERSMYCKGCREDRSVHWSPDCWILQCCVDEKGLAFCYECGDFPCERLSEWAKGSAKYAQALDRLQRVRGVL
jgi:hypothetical protein